MNYRLFFRMEEKGQTLLIVVLVMVVALTVGLSVVLRSITNVRISTEEANSQRAFSAAEAGIEQALRSGQNITAPQTLDNNSVIQAVTVASLAGSEFLINGGNPIERNDAVDVWLVEHNTDGSINYSSGWQLLNGNKFLTIYWGTSSVGCDNAALEVLVVSGVSTAPTVTRYVWDPCIERRAANQFSFNNPVNGSGSYRIGAKDFNYYGELTVSNNSKGIVVRITPLYKKTPLAIRGCTGAQAPPHGSCTDLPSQGKIIESTGISDNTVRKVTFFQGYSKVPAEFFPHAVFEPR